MRVQNVSTDGQVPPDITVTVQEPWPVHNGGDEDGAEQRVSDARDQVAHIVLIGLGCGVATRSTQGVLDLSSDSLARSDATIDV